MIWNDFAGNWILRPLKTVSLVRKAGHRTRNHSGVIYRISATKMSLHWSEGTVYKKQCFLTQGIKVSLRCCASPQFVSGLQA